MPEADSSVMGGVHQKRRREQGNPEINSNSNRSQIREGFHYERHEMSKQTQNNDDMSNSSIKELHTV